MRKLRAIKLGSWRLPANALISILLLAASVALRIADPVPVSRLRLSVFDSYLRAAPRTIDPTFPVRVVAIDEESLARIGQWPWPRTRLAALISRLKDAGAASITFDLVFAEPDRFSPNEILRALSADTPKDVIAELAKLPSNDARLADAMRAAPVVLGIAGDRSTGRTVPRYEGAISFAGDDPAEFAHAYAGGVEPLPVLMAAASGVGAVNWLPSEDQVVRRIPLLVSIAGELYPSLALEAFRVGENQSTLFVKASGGSGIESFGQRTGIESIRVGHAVLPTDGQGELWLKFAPTDPRRTISAYRILDGAFDSAEIKDRQIIIGATAAGLLDLRATPLDPAVPGVEVHAQAIEQMLSGDNLIRPPYATGAEILFLAALGALVAWLMGRSGAVLAALAGVSAIAAVILGSWLSYTRAGLLFDPVYPALAVAVIYLGSSLTSYVQSEIERAHIRAAFSHYVAPTLVAEIAKNYDKLKLGGETRDVTLLFADVRGFSKISESLSAEELVRFVNRLFTPLAETILAHGGTIDKFMGDAVMAFWNAPLADRTHAANACRAALAMLEDVAELNSELRQESEKRGTSFKPVQIGIGLNTGECVVGNVGSPQRFDYSVLGDVVNVASRFEEATKTHRTAIIVGERTAAEAGGFAFLELGAVTPRGKDRPERILALVGDEALAAAPSFSALKAAHEKLLKEAAAGGNESDFAAALEKCRELALPSIAAFYMSPQFTAAARSPRVEAS